MSSVKVIVQNIPLNAFNLRHSIHYCADCPNPDYCIDKDKTFLENLLSKYGPSRCTYLWSSEIVESRLNNNSYNNFAEMMFCSASDASRACKAANNLEIKIDDRVLTLTAVSDNVAPIDMLDDLSLILTFSLLNTADKLIVEKVCKRWEGLALRSWSKIKTLDLFHMPYDGEQLKQYMLRCGSHLEEMTSSVMSLCLFHLIRDYCKSLKILTLDVVAYTENIYNDMTIMVKALRQLRSLTLMNLVKPLPSTLFENLPEEMEKLDIECCFYKPQSLDLSRFRNLRSLSLNRYRIDEGDLRGLEYMSNLEHLSFIGCKIHGSHIEKVQNFTNLKVLRISPCEINDNVLTRILTNHRNLECLDISNNCTLTDRSVVLASTLSHLRILNVSDCDKLTLSSMDEMLTLEGFNCSNCNSVNNEAVGRIIQLSPNVKTVDVQHCSLITLELCEIANSAVEKRDNGVPLQIKASFFEDDVVQENLSPLLTIDCLGAIFPPFQQSDDLYNDISANNYGYVVDEDCDLDDLDDFDDTEFEMF